MRTTRSNRADKTTRLVGETKSKRGSHSTTAGRKPAAAKVRRSGRATPVAGGVASAADTTDEGDTRVARRDTKQAQVLAMLRRPAGATVAAIAAAVCWQPHSVRGFLAGVVRKKLSLDLISEPADKGRIYRVVNGDAAEAPASAQVRQAT